MMTDVADTIDAKVGSKEFDKATALASQWTQDEPQNAKAWSKLAHVQELNRDFPEATIAIKRALGIKTDHPPYLFKLGVVEFRSQQFDEAALAFAQCVQASVNLGDDYYLDAAKVAQARSLLLAGEAEDAQTALDGVPDDAATWLDGRWTAAAVSQEVTDALDDKSRSRIKPGG